MATPLSSVGATPLTQHLTEGKLGEDIACKHVRNLGYEILGSNIRLGKDEIDLIAFDPEDSVLVFIEVKTRAHAHRDYTPELNITPHKKACMARAARRWMYESGMNEVGYRLDVVCVAGRCVVAHYREVVWEG